MSGWPTTAEVLIVGAGPVGLALANLLGQAGADVLLVEQNAGLSETPKAILIDDESFRTFQAAGLAERILPDVLYDYGARYYTSGGRCLARVRPTATEYGFARRSSFNQPELERRLLEGLRRFTNVDVRFLSKLIALDPDTGVAQIESGGGVHTVQGALIAGCDGGRSAVRELCGIAMSGLSFAERWLIVDTENDPDDSRYTKFVCDPARPLVSVPAPRGGRRYEFMLHPHEDASAVTTFEAVERFLAPYRQIAPGDIIRKAVYTFHAVIAERFRQGRAVLVGDAAHMMPPFAGQGMNTGIRDAHNLAWKLLLCLRGADLRLLDTYERERRPHVRAMIDLSVFLGHVVMPTSRIQALGRDAFFTALSIVPPVKTYITTMRWKPQPRMLEGFVMSPGGGRRLNGRMLPQPVVTLPSGARASLDDVLGAGFALIAADPTDPGRLKHPLWDHLGAKRLRVLCDDRSPAPTQHGVVGDVRDQLKTVLAGHPGEILLVRPDRYIAGGFAPEDEAAFAAAVEAKLALAPSLASTAPALEPAL